MGHESQDGSSIPDTSNLFMISAPYQLLSALEVVSQFGLVNNHLRIIDTGHFTREQFDCVIDPARWESVVFHNFRYLMPDRDFGAHPPVNLRERLIEIYLVLDQARKRWLANRVAQSAGPVNCLVMGNYRRYYDQHMRHLVNRFQFKHLYLLDVGTDTLKVNEDRHVERAMGGKDETVIGEAGLLKQLKLWIRRKYVDWDNSGVDSVVFFTVYNLDPVPGDKIVRNKYTYLRSVVASARQSNKVLFVGQPLVDQCYITNDVFENLMARIKNYFDGQDLVYVAHPRESEMQLQVVRDLELSIQKFDSPFEYAVSFSGERPACIASFFSSVNENSAAIFRDTVKVLAFRLPESLLLKERNEVNCVYSRFARKSCGVVVIDQY